METPREILQQYWGYGGFRPLQEEIINSIIDGHDTLALLPTGGGKSVCYQVPAMALPGMCLVVSPLIALMTDQVNRLTQIGIPAATLHSGMAWHEVKTCLENAVNDDYKLLYVSPERLQTRMFQDYMEQMQVSLIAVDEAHCISQWGHDFRPSYLRIAEIRSSFPDAPILALTATATTMVQEDIMSQLRMADPVIFRQSFKRDNIAVAVRYSENKQSETFDELGAGAAIVYCRSRRQTEVIARYLEQSGVASTSYHAGMDKDQRDEAQAAWMEGKSPVMVATTAFGMGIDKPDVRTVLHYDAPESLEAYYQEAGRAGRDGAPAQATTLFNSADIVRLVESVNLQFPHESYLRKVYQAVAEFLQIPIGGEPDRYFAFDVTDFCGKFSLKPAEVLPALRLLERDGLWTLTESVYNPATIRFLADRHTVDELDKQDRDLAYVSTGLLRMYNSVFFFATPVRETAICRQLRMSREELDKILGRLHRMKIIEYCLPVEGPKLYFHHYRVDSRHLNINTRRILQLRRRHVERIRAMIQFLEQDAICRTRLVLNYFGEQSDTNCGNCDVCKNRGAKGRNNAYLKGEILTTLFERHELPLKQLLRDRTEPEREAILTMIRELMDHEVVFLKEDDVLYLKQSGG